MRARVLLALVLAALLLVQHRLTAWGFDVHRLITDRAIDRLPEEIRPFFQKHRGFIVEHSIDPDLWRVAGWREEPPRHFLDMDSYGPPPFDELPRELDRAIAQYGIDFVSRNGLLPWRTSEVFGDLRRAFDQHRRQVPGYALENAKFFSAVLAHYVADGHVPLHAVKNYDGQLTGQHGVHSRWETELVLRYRDVWTFAAEPLHPVPEPRTFMFAVLTDAFPHAERILAADRAATEGRTAYDDQYFEVLRKETAPIVDRQLSKAVTAVASMITAAWEAGGRPDLPLDPPRRVREIK